MHGIHLLYRGGYLLNISTHPHNDLTGLSLYDNAKVIVSGNTLIPGSLLKSINNISNIRFFIVTQLNRVARKRCDRHLFH